MADFLIPFLTGAAQQYISDEDSSDALKANIIDNVSKKIYDTEIPQAEKEIAAMKEIKKGIENQYGPGVSKAFENMGFFDSGDETITMNTIRTYLNDLKKNRNVTEDQFKTKVNKLYTDSQGVGTASTEAAAAFKNQFGGSSPLDLRITKLEDRKTKVKNLFNDRANIRDLLVAPDAPKEGVRGFLFGDRVTPSGVLGATGRLTEATKVDTPDVTTEDRDATKSIFPQMASGEIFDFNNSKHTGRLNQAERNFNKQFFNSSLNEYNFNLDKTNPNYDTAEYIKKGYKEAKAKGYQFGLVDYARERYIDYTLSTMFGITGYASQSGLETQAPTTELQPGTAKDTQVGTKIKETQTIVPSEDVGAISAVDTEAKTKDEVKKAIEKTEKVSLPKSTKIEISEGDSLPAPSQIPEKSPGLRLANDGMFYVKGKAVKMYPPAETEIEDAQAVVFQIKARDDISDEEKAKAISDLKQDLLSTLSGMGITQYVPVF
tara:strand:- start:975 stop:2441 length:1467 start_codon:yes stop_codon:yes gene_type:complete